ncbi:MAG: hypothetical protein AAF688_14950, partial [Bacteroidota bacterium]
MQATKYRGKWYYLNGYTILVILGFFLFKSAYDILFVSFKANIFLTIYVQLWGIVFLLAYFFEENNFVFRWAIKICKKST